MKKELPVTITDGAKKEIIAIRNHKNIADEYHLRLGVKSAGCGVASFIIGFDYANEKDEIYTLDGLTVVIEKMQLMYLAGKAVDYGESDGKTGFIFRDKS